MSAVIVEATDKLTLSFLVTRQIILVEYALDILTLKSLMRKAVDVNTLDVDKLTLSSLVRLQITLGANAPVIELEKSLMRKAVNVKLAAVARLLVPCIELAVIVAELDRLKELDNDAEVVLVLVESLANEKAAVEAACRFRVR